MSDSPEILINSEESELARALPSFDSQKFLFILKKSIPVIILILAAGIFTAVMIVRYTKPVFQSSSIIKLDIKSEASVLGLSNMGEVQNFNNLSSEIELLRSRLFFNKVLDEVNIDVSVYTIGNILNDEKYPFSPFKIDYQIHNGYYYDKPFYVDVLENNQYRLKYSKGNDDIIAIYRFGDKVITDDFILRISKTVGYGGDIQGEDFFLIFNSHNMDTMDSLNFP